MPRLIGVMSDTHEDTGNALCHIVEVFKKLNVVGIVHCGDIDKKHLNPKLFNNLPVVCALTEEQASDPAFVDPPKDWVYTRPGDRVRVFCGAKMYVGHKKSFEFLTGSESKLAQAVAEIRKNYDGVDWLFSGHTHHQICDQGRLITFVNPGAVESSSDGYEYVVINLDTGGVVFSRLPKVKPVIEQFRIGVISDTFNVSDLIPTFWKDIASQMTAKAVKNIIHCGNISLKDIGRPELSGFEVYFNLRADQTYHGPLPSNWHLIPLNNPIVEINGYKFYIQLDFGAEISKQSECELDVVARDLLKKYPEISFVLCGFSRSAFLEEGQLLRIINPGGAVCDQGFAVIGLPVAEITFDHILFPPLPPIE